MIHPALHLGDFSALSHYAREESICAVADAAVVPPTVAVISFRRYESDLISLSSERASYPIDAQHAGAIKMVRNEYCHESARAEMRSRSEFLGVIEWVRAGRGLPKNALLNLDGLRLFGHSSSIKTA